MYSNLFSSKGKSVSIESLENGSCFLMDLRGHKVVTLRLPRKAAREMSGQDLISPSSIFSKFKAILGPKPETEQWLVVSSVHNPLLERIDDFKTLIAGNLTDATGIAVSDASLTVCASIPVNGKQQASEALEDEIDASSRD